MALQKALEYYRLELETSTTTLEREPLHLENGKHDYGYVEDVYSIHDSDDYEPQV